jgi:hypothetical protein
LAFHYNYIGSNDVGHLIPQATAAGPTQHQDRRRKGTRVPSPDVFNESDGDPDMETYLNEDMFEPQVQIF